MASTTAKHISLRFMVWNMRWMNRYAGFMAKLMVRKLAGNMVIACGLRDQQQKTVHIIYAPESENKDYKILLINQGK